MGQAADIVRKYVELYSDGTPENYGSDRCLALFAPGADCFVAPTSRQPLGERGGVELFKAGFEANAAVLRNRKIELLELIESVDKTAWNGIWTAFIGVDGLPMPKGTELKVHMAAFTEVKDGYIIRHSEYLTAPEGAAATNDIDDI